MIWIGVAFICFMMLYPQIYWLFSRPTHINGLFCIVAPKHQECIKAMRDLGHQNIHWIDVTSVPILNIPIVDTKSNEIAQNKRMTLGSKHAESAASNHFFLMSNFQYNNEVPHFILVKQGELLDSTTGYPNRWFTAM